MNVLKLPSPYRLHKQMDRFSLVIITIKTHGQFFFFVERILESVVEPVLLNKTTPQITLALALSMLAR